MKTTTTPTATQRNGFIARSARLVKKLRPRSGYDVIAVIAMTAALGTSGAYAAGVITGADVQDGSLTGIDVQDGSIGAADLGTGLSRHVKAVNVAPHTYGDAVVVCPAGKKAVGGGFTKDLGLEVIDSLSPASAAWFVRALNTSPYTKVLEASVQCAAIS